MRNNKHLSLEERIQIGVLYQAKNSIDSVESSRKPGKNRSCLIVIVDRMTRKTIIRKTALKTAKLTTTSIIKALKPYRNTIKSITYDNGCEFSKHEIINKTLNTKSYFCKPYQSWKKGSVENFCDCFLNVDS